MIFETIIKYLATPYLHDRERVMDFRANVADAIAADLMNKGEYVYSPISSWHHIAKKYSLPRDWDFWNGLDRQFIKVCSGLYVSTLEGWKESTGVTAEIEIAKELNIPVKHIDPIPHLKGIKIPQEYSDLREKVNE